MPNYYPLVVLNSKNFFEGKWAKNEHDSMLSRLPIPLATDQPVRRKFLKRLKFIIKDSYPEYLEVTKPIHNRFEESDDKMLCSLCHNSKSSSDSDSSDDTSSNRDIEIDDDFKINNNRIYKIKYKGKNYEFYGAIVHYYEFHNVQPSEEFKEAVNGFYKKYYKNKTTRNNPYNEKF